MKSFPLFNTLRKTAAALSDGAYDYKAYNLEPIYDVKTFTAADMDAAGDKLKFFDGNVTDKALRNQILGSDGSVETNEHHVIVGVELALRAGAGETAANVEEFAKAIQRMHMQFKAGKIRVSETLGRHVLAGEVGFDSDGLFAEPASSMHIVAPLSLGQNDKYSAVLSVGDAALAAFTGTSCTLEATFWAMVAGADIQAD